MLEFHEMFHDDDDDDGGGGGDDMQRFNMR